MKMSNQEQGILLANVKHDLNFKTLYTVNGQNLVFKNHFQNALLGKKSSNLKNDDMQYDLLKIKLSVNNHDTILDWANF